MWEWLEVERLRAEILMKERRAVHVPDWLNAQVFPTGARGGYHFLLETPMFAHGLAAAPALTQLRDQSYAATYLGGAFYNLDEPARALLGVSIHLDLQERNTENLPVALSNLGTSLYNDTTHDNGRVRRGIRYHKPFGATQSETRLSRTVRWTTSAPQWRHHVLGSNRYLTPLHIREAYTAQR